MRDEFLEFLREPSQVNFLAVRMMLLTHEAYQPYSDDLDRIHDLYNQQKFEEANSLCKESFPNLLLSPRAHLLLALTAQKLGKEEEAEMEYFIFERCLEGIVGTGNGTEQKPYLVLRTSDEYDLLQHLE